MNIQGYCTLLGVLINCYGYKFDEKNQPDRDELILLALAELLMRDKAMRGEITRSNAIRIVKDILEHPTNYNLDRV